MYELEASQEIYALSLEFAPSSRPGQFSKQQDIRIFDLGRISPPVSANILIQGRPVAERRDG